jgi:hypothetical protein
LTLLQGKKPMHGGGRAVKTQQKTDSSAPDCKTAAEPEKLLAARQTSPFTIPEKPGASG